MFYHCIIVVDYTKVGKLATAVGIHDSVVNYGVIMIGDKSIMVDASIIDEGPIDGVCAIDDEGAIDGKCHSDWND